MVALTVQKQSALDRWWRGACRRHLGAGHAPLRGAVHEGRERQPAAALSVPLPEELFFQLVGPPLVCARGGRQVANVCTLEHHLHTPPPRFGPACVIQHACSDWVSDKS